MYACSLSSDRRIIFVVEPGDLRLCAVVAKGSRLETLKATVGAS